MPDFDTRRPQESDEPNGLRSRSLTNRVRNSLIANRLRTLLIGGWVLLIVVVGISVGLVTYSFGGPGALMQEPLGEVPNGKIAFLKGDRDIYVTNPDGTGVRNLTNASGVEEDIPAWSPDGEQIAFEAAPPYDLFVMNADGSGRTQLTDTLGVDAPSPGGNVKVGIFGGPVWSPDSEKIAFTRSIGDITHNATADSAPVESAQPDWEESGIYVVNADGSGQSSLIDQPARRLINEAPAWSPDGERIAFESGREDTTAGDIYVMNADGTGRMRLTNTAEWRESNPTWSPDGKYIAFWSGGICLMKADGSTGRRCVANDHNVFSAIDLLNGPGIAWGRG